MRARLFDVDRELALDDSVANVCEWLALCVGADIGWIVLFDKANFRRRAHDFRELEFKGLEDGFGACWGHDVLRHAVVDVVEDDVVSDLYTAPAEPMHKVYRHVESAPQSEVHRGESRVE